MLKYECADELSGFNYANIMFADSLAPCVAKKSIPMILNM